MTESKSTPLEQLKHALETGAIDQGTFDVAATALNAQHTSGGASAQGQDALAVGAGGIAVTGDNEGTINLGVLIKEGDKAGASPEGLTRAYLARIVSQTQQLPLLASDSATTPVRLSSIYTALLTQRGEAHERAAISPEDLDALFPDRSKNTLSALDVLDREAKLVLLGGPGSGKSTFVNFVAMAMAGELLGISAPNLETLTAPLPESDDDEKHRDSKRQPWRHGALLPVPVVLRDLASQLPPANTPVNAGTVWAFICEHLRRAALEAFAPVLQRQLLENGGLILLDGLDEVPDANNRRVQIKQAVNDFAATYDKCRFLVTSRTYAYQNQDWKLEGFAETPLLPFTQAQICRFADLWYDHMVELDRLTRADASNRAALLKRTVERNERVRELTERPLLLTLIAQLQTEGSGELPEKRETLYDKAVEMLLTKWETMKVRVLEDGTKAVEPSLAEWLNAGRDDIRKQLNRLAFEAHRDQPKLTGTADIRQETLIAALLAATTRDVDFNVGLLEKYLRDRAGILAAHGDKVYQFPHRSFQEYLAACHLTDDDFPDKLAKLACADANRWREVALLAGAKAARGSALNGWALAETLCPAPVSARASTIDAQWGALLAGRVLVECTDLTNIPQRNVEKHARIRDWQLALVRSDALPATERALAGRSLATLGDSRPEVMTLDGMHFCVVPRGPFVMGSDDVNDEKPQHTVDIANPYFMARFPVTVAQWREYLKASGQTQSDEPRHDGWNNEPVVNVSWHKAVQFCEFLTHAWRGALPDGFSVDLPSEAEWEKAARGGLHIPAKSEWLSLPQLTDALAQTQDISARANPMPARAYPFAETFDSNNTNVQSVIGETSAVGCFPGGKSPYGCEEMSGNVWEWTRSLWGTNLAEPEFGYPYDPEDAKREAHSAGDSVLRLVRGGSWDDHRADARCAFRLRFRPDFRLINLGFRVVLRSAPIS